MKQMNKLLSCVGLALMLIALTACQTRVQASALSDNLPPILERHDAYAQVMLADPTEALNESQTVRGVYEQNIDGYLPDTIHPVILEVLDRHDSWVRMDESLPELNRDIYLDSSRAVRLLFEN